VSALTGLDTFEVITLSRTDLIEWPEILRELEKRILKSEIKVVDIRRRKDCLTIVLRKLQGD
jgi:hypothetical protein